MIIESVANLSVCVTNRSEILRMMDKTTVDLRPTVRVSAFRPTDGVLAFRPTGWVLAFRPTV